MEVKRSIVHDFIMAEVKTRYLIRDEKDDIPHPWEYYPELFAEERVMYQKEKDEKELIENKQARMAYAAEFNRRRRQE